MSAQVFTYECRVTYADCTLGNHVYYARYLHFLEAARSELFRTLGKTLLQWQQEGTVFPVIECRLRYRAPARYDNILQIETWVDALERVRVSFGHRILLKENQRLILESQTDHVCTSLDEKPKRLPEELSSALARYAKAASH